jgi:hypothetical protein
VSVLHDSLDSLWGVLTSLSQKGAGIFACVNETNFQGRKAGDIVRVRALFADLDGAPLANAWDVPLTPGWITRTSEGRTMCFGVLSASPSRTRRFKKRSHPKIGITRSTGPLSAEGP